MLTLTQELLIWSYINYKTNKYKDKGIMNMKSQSLTPNHKIYGRAALVSLYEKSRIFQLFKAN